MLAATYSCLATTIGADGLNCRVRNENGCNTVAKPPTQKAQSLLFVERRAIRLRSCELRRDKHKPHPPSSLQTSAWQSKTKIRKQKLSSFVLRQAQDYGWTQRDSHNSFREFCRGISTSRLNALLHFHLTPINVVISHDPITIPHLGAGFPLRCFQRLSNPDIATGRCTWRYSPQTRGQFISVLSY